MASPWRRPHNQKKLHAASPIRIDSCIRTGAAFQLRQMLAADAGPLRERLKRCEDKLRQP
jgi:hypothetical protein